MEAQSEIEAELTELFQAWCDHIVLQNRIVRSIWVAGSKAGVNDAGKKHTTLMARMYWKAFLDARSSINRHQLKAKLPKWTAMSRVPVLAAENATTTAGLDRLFLWEAKEWLRAFDLWIGMDRICDELGMPRVMTRKNRRLANRIRFCHAMLVTAFDGKLRGKFEMLAEQWRGE